MAGVPKCIRSDNGPEFITKAIRRWQLDVAARHIESGSPWENGYAEQFENLHGQELVSEAAVEASECRPPAHHDLERGLQSPPTTRFAEGVRDLGGIFGPLCCFHSGEDFGYGESATLRR